MATATRYFPFVPNWLSLSFTAEHAKNEEDKKVKHKNHIGKNILANSGGISVFFKVNLFMIDY